MHKFHLSIIALFPLLILASCENNRDANEEEPTSAMLHGEILNPKNDFIQIRGSSEYLDTIWLSPQGTFESEVQLDSAQRYTFLHGGEYASLYLTPGDSLQINLDTDEFDESLTFSGRGEIPNRYLVKSLLLQEDWDRKYPFKDLHELDPKVFLQVVDSMYQEQEVLLSKLNKALPDNTFVEKEGTSIAYKKALQLYNYEKARMRSLGIDSVALPENYYAFVNELDLNNPDNLGTPSFKQFLYVYLEDEAQKYRNQHPDTSGNAFIIRSKLNAIDENITNPTVREEAYADVVTQQINYYGTEGIRELMPELKENIEDSAKLASINELLDKWEQLSKGKPAPAISGTSLDGQRVKVSDFTGNLVYVDVWATWCGPCLREIPYLEELQESFNDKPVKFVSISIDDDKKAWEEMVQEDELGGIQIHADNEDREFTEKYMIRGIPRFILIDEEGMIISADASRPSQDAEGLIRENLPSKGMAMNRD